MSPSSSSGYNILPGTTILLKNLPAVHDLDNQKTLAPFAIGIDFNFFDLGSSTTTNNSKLTQLKGIKLIDSGLHFIHYVNTSLGIRAGFYINCHEGDLFIFQWDNNLEEFKVFLFDKKNELIFDNTKTNKRKIEQVDDDVDEYSLNFTMWKKDVLDDYSYMINYSTLSNQENFTNQDWKSQISHVSMDLINEIFPKQGRPTFNNQVSSILSTLDASKEENEKLLTALYNSASERLNNVNTKQASADLENDPMIKALKSEVANELRYTTLEFKKTIRPNASLQQVTADSLDKSWYLKNLVETQFGGYGWNRLIGELQVAFINLCILNNFNSGEQWINLVKLILMSFNAIEENQIFYILFLEKLLLQLNKLPVELVEDGEQEQEAILKLKSLTTTFNNFKRFIFYDIESNDKEIKEIQKMTLKLLGVLNSKFNMFIKVEDDDEDDEDDDDYKPVIVDV
ncbi:hypothetical protein PACTADRAFT_73910 [Pachysolen tannophilus NRRL Y-2460]|uniref:A1 cistron-splicing factor AAR2 n=1 Tax=Pachysolen tannophilus NRRL Y-2460 TaxID=669874 RepID=A0A1E4U354_PACTA|nr:hypothetical protein PACTADRAFT_73910 [Pachysolen tannophilus NRRL Y-2460]